MEAFNLGGCFYVHNPEGDINFESITVARTKSRIDGGFMYTITDSLTPTEVTLFFKNSVLPRALSMTETSALGKGGAFYIDHPKFNVLMN
jgi:hypothetical protein